MSGRLDSNQRPPTPEAGALTGLRYTPNYFNALIILRAHKDNPNFRKVKIIFKKNLFPAQPPPLRLSASPSLCLSGPHTHGFDSATTQSDNSPPLGGSRTTRTVLHTGHIRPPEALLPAGQGVLQVRAPPIKTFHLSSSSPGGTSQPLVVAVEQLAVIAVQVHAAAQAVAEHPAVGTRTPPRPLAVAEGLETVLPHIPEVVAVDVALVEVGADRRAARNGAVDTDRGDRHPRGTLVELVADLGLVAAEEPLAGIAGVDAPLAAGAADELQHLAKLRIGHAQALVVFGPPHREDREQTPRLHPLGDEQVAERLQMRHHRPRHAGHHVEGQPLVAHGHAHGLERPFVAVRVAADVVVLLLKPVEAYGHRPQPRLPQPPEAFGRQRQAVGHHAPRIAAAHDLAARLFEVLAHEHLAARKDDEHMGRIDMRRDLLVKHPEEIRQRHVRHAGIDAAVAAAMTASQIAAQRTLPEERIETVRRDLRGIQVRKDIEGQAFAQAQPATGHPSARILLRCTGEVGHVVGRLFEHRRQRIRPGAQLLDLLGRQTRRRYAVHDLDAQLLRRVGLHLGGILRRRRRLAGNTPDRRAGGGKSQKGRYGKFQFSQHRPRNFTFNTGTKIGIFRGSQKNGQKVLKANDFYVTLPNINTHNRIYMKGKVKWFDSKKGYGFITSENGKEIFVHFSGIAAKGFKSLNEGQTVEFEVANGAKGEQAVNVTVVEQ